MSYFCVFKKFSFFFFFEPNSTSKLCIFHKSCNYNLDPLNSIYQLSSAKFPPPSFNTDQHNACSNLWSFSKVHTLVVTFTKCFARRQNIVPFCIYRFCKFKGVARRHDCYFYSRVNDRKFVPCKRHNMEYTIYFERNLDF